MIGIIAAMQEEVNELLALMQDTQKQEHSHIRFYVGKLQEKDIVLMESGVGKGNAAMSCTVLLERFAPTHIINIGTAGGLSLEENILDIVVSERIVQHDYDTSCIDGEAGIGLYFESDENLRQACMKVLTEVKKPYHVGMIASGDQFVHSEQQLHHLHTLFPEAICAEMEAGAIAQVCSSYQVPYVILRSLSDIAPKKDSHMDFLEYVKHASKTSAKVCEQLMKHI